MFFPNQFDGYYTAKLIIAEKPTNNWKSPVCKQPMDLEIKINVKDNKIKGFIIHHGKCENSDKCNSFNNGIIEGEVNEKGKFVKFKIKQNSNIGKKEGAYTVKGNFKKSTILAETKI